MEITTYQTTPEQNGNGTYFFTDCGHWMFSVKNQMAYHGCLCPGCMFDGRNTTLYIRGSKEANECLKGKLSKRYIRRVNF